MAVPFDPAAELEEMLRTATEHHMAGRLEQAAAGYGQVLAQRPDHGVTLHRVGILALQTGQPALAGDLLARAVALDPAAWWSHCSRGQALEAMGRSGDALGSFRLATTLNPDCLEAWLGAGAACRTLGLGQEALAAYRQAARLAPDRAEVQNNLGIVLGRSGRLDESIREFEEALRIRPGLIDARYNLAVSLRKEGRTGEADEQFEEVRRLRQSPGAAH